MLENFDKAGKIFIFGMLIGTFFLLITEISFEPAAEATLKALETKARSFPQEDSFLSLAIFLNNTLAASLASIVPAGFVLFMLWGRKNVELWKKIGGGKLSASIDEKIWKLITKLKDDASKIPDKLGREVYILAYGIPCLVMVVNGWLFGFLITNELVQSGLAGMTEFLKWTLPHGIIEIPALIASASLGYSLADRLLDPFYKISETDMKKKVKAQIKSRKTLKGWIVIISVLLLATIIETFLTPTIA